MQFDWLRLRWRITLGFGLLIALMLAISVLAMVDLSRAGDAVRAMNQGSASMRRQRELTYLLETIRRAETRFRIDAIPSATEEAVRTEDRVCCWRKRLTRPSRKTGERQTARL
jgi:type II secretory pathway component PulJ